MECPHRQQKGFLEALCRKVPADPSGLPSGLTLVEESGRSALMASSSAMLHNKKTKVICSLRGASYTSMFLQHLHAESVTSTAASSSAVGASSVTASIAGGGSEVRNGLALAFALNESGRSSTDGADTPNNRTHQTVAKSSSLSRMAEIDQEFPSVRAPGG